MTKRYSQMIPIVETFLPRTMIEVGVHRAVRASKLAEIVLSSSPRAKFSYTGFDVFATMPMEFQKAALNGKGMALEGIARARLEKIQRDFCMPETGETRFNFKFVIGDTRETLHGKNYSVDFAFIDGDHRVDAIAGDFAALADTKIVVFDDYYVRDDNGNMVDTEKYGCNKTVDGLDREKYDVEILPHGDRVVHGGHSHLVVARRK